MINNQVDNPDKLKQFYDKLSTNENIGKLPNYDTFKATLDDTTKRRAFYDNLSKNPSISLPDYESFQKTLFTPTHVRLAQQAATQQQQPEQDEVTSDLNDAVTQAASMTANPIFREVTLPSQQGFRPEMPQSTDASRLETASVQEFGRAEEIKAESKGIIDSIILPEPVKEFEVLANRLNETQAKIQEQMGFLDTNPDNPDYDSILESTNALIEQFNQDRDFAKNIAEQLEGQGFVFKKREYFDFVEKRRELGTRLAQVNEELQELSKASYAPMPIAAAGGGSVVQMGMFNTDRKKRDELLEQKSALNKEIVELELSKIGRPDMDKLQQIEARIADAIRSSEGTAQQLDYIQQAKAVAETYEGLGIELRSFTEKENSKRRFQQVLSSLASSGAETVAGSLEFVSIAAKALDNYVGAEDKDLEEYYFAQTAQKLRNLAEYYFPGKPELQDSFVFSIVPGAIASMAGFVAAGGALSKLKSVTAQTVGMGVMAGGMSTSEMYRIAKDVYDVTDDEALEVAGWGFVPGIFEVFPVARLLNRFDKYTGGTLKTNMKTYLKEGLKGGVEEAVFEAMGGLGRNKVEQIFLNEDKDIYEGLQTEGAAGGIAGFVLNFGMAFLAGRKFNRSASEAPIQLHALNTSINALEKFAKDNENAKKELALYKKTREELIGLYGDAIRQELTEIDDKIDAFEINPRNDANALIEYENLKKQQELLRSALSGAPITEQITGEQDAIQEQITDEIPIQPEAPSGQRDVAEDLSITDVVDAGEGQAQEEGVRGVGAVGEVAPGVERIDLTDGRRVELELGKPAKVFKKNGEEYKRNSPQYREAIAKAFEQSSFDRIDQATAESMMQESGMNPRQLAQLANQTNDPFFTASLYDFVRDMQPTGIEAETQDADALVAKTMDELGFRYVSPQGLRTETGSRKNELKGLWINWVRKDARVTAEEAAEAINKELGTDWSGADVLDFMLRHPGGIRAVGVTGLYQNELDTIKDNFFDKFGAELTDDLATRLAQDYYDRQGAITEDADTQNNLKVLEDFFGGVSEGRVVDPAEESMIADALFELDKLYTEQLKQQGFTDEQIAEIELQSQLEAEGLAEPIRQGDGEAEGAVVPPRQAEAVTQEVTSPEIVKQRKVVDEIRTERDKKKAEIDKRNDLFEGEAEDTGLFEGQKIDVQAGARALEKLNNQLKTAEDKLKNLVDKEAEAQRIAAESQVEIQIPDNLKDRYTKDYPDIDDTTINRVAQNDQSIMDSWSKLDLSGVAPYQYRKLPLYERLFGLNGESVSTGLLARLQNKLRGAERGLAGEAYSEQAINDTRKEIEKVLARRKPVTQQEIDSANAELAKIREQNAKDRQKLLEQKAKTEKEKQDIAPIVEQIKSDKELFDSLKRATGSTNVESFAKMIADGKTDIAKMKQTAKAFDMLYRLDDGFIVSDKRIPDGTVRNTIANGPAYLAELMAKKAQPIQRQNVDRIIQAFLDEGLITKAQHKFLVDTFDVTDLSKVEPVVQPPLSQTEQELIELVEEFDDIVNDKKIKAKNLRDLYRVNRELFGLNQSQSLASAIIMDRMVGQMAKRDGITKAKMYEKIQFDKGVESKLLELSEKGKALLQIVGENAQLADNIRGNLDTARDMESAGKDAKTIRIATGWEKGADGKWRYEVDDPKIDLSGFADKKILSDKLSFNGVVPTNRIIQTILFDYYKRNNKKFRDRNTWESFINDNDANFTQKEVDGARLFLGNLIDNQEISPAPFYESDSTALVLRSTLGEILDDSLLKMYPTLRYIDVEIKVNGSRSDATPRLDIEGYISNNKFIGIETPKYNIKPSEALIENKERIKSVLLHEIQHAIQDIEGFTRGASQAGLQYRLNELKNKIRENDKLNNAWQNATGKKEKQRALEAYQKSIMEFPSREYNLLSRYAPKSLTGQTYSMFDAYLKVAGEVEARNVQARMVMSPEERSVTMLQETEDVARDEQILFYGLDGIMQQVTAWHGSPYQFDKFSTEKIGTGEGMQAFGWGLYFTELQDIAKRYSETKPKYNVLIGGKNISEVADELGNMRYGINLGLQWLKGFHSQGYSKQRIISSLIQESQGTSFYYDIQKLVDYIKDKEIKKVDDAVPSMYKVSLHQGKTPDQYDWLDWDRNITTAQRNKIAQQAVKEGLDKIAYTRDGKPVLNTSDNIDGYGIYKELTKSFGLGSQKEASLFLLRAGIDGVKYPAESVARGVTSDTARGFNYVVFDDTAVSIEEVIKFQKAANRVRGAMMMGMDGQATIYALSDPNVSTPLHEMAHVFEHYLTADERNTVKSWANTPKWDVETSEKFARGFEKYLAEGKAPTTGLAKIFERFKEWLTQIYNGIKGSDIDLELNDGMRVIYSEMLGADTVTKDFPKKPKVAKPKAEPKKIADYTIIEKSNRLTMPVVDSITVDGNPIETGMPFSIKTYRGTGGGSTVSMPFGSVVPDATFYALSETTAKMYGKEVIEATLDIKNPLVIDSDAQLKSLGINTSEPNPFTKKAFQDALEKHDAVVIIVSPVYDSNAKGENSKRLRKIFDHTQIFTRKEVAKPKSEQAKVKADKARDELKGLMDDFIKDFGSDLNAGLNPQAIGASAKIIAKGAELGFRKFEQFGYFVIENFGADKFKSIYQSFKAAYMANIGVDNQFNEDLNAISKLSADQVIKQYEAQDETTADIQVEPEGAIDVAEGAEVIQPGLADQRTAVRVQRVQGDRQGAPAQKETTPGQRPAMIYASRSMPEPKLYIDETSYPFIDEHQIFGVNLMLEAFETGKKGFMLADSTGIGKTAQILTVANELVNRGKKVLILTQNQQIIDGSFTNDSQMLGIDKNKFTITTYTQLGAGKVKGQYDVVIYDEAHNLKNPDSLRSSAAQGLNTAFSIFATATPMDTSTSAVYFMEKVTGQSREQIYRRMGLNVVERVNRKTNQTYVTVEPMKGFNIKELPKRLIEIREDMIRDGVMVRREYPFYGEVSETSVSVNQDFADMIEAASDYWFDKMEGLPPHILKNIKGQYVLEMARLNELSKVDDTFNMAMKELKEGRSVVIIGETAGKQTIKGLSETLQALSSKNEFDGALTQLARKFKEKGFDTANIYGAGDKSSEVDRFQRGDVRIALATPQSGGTGINLDDSIGGKPRTLIMMTANFSGNQFQQIIGRVSRRNTKTPAKFTILMNDTTSDSHKRGKVADKLATLKAIQDGVLGEFSDFDNVAKTSEELAPSSEGLPVAPSGFSYISTGKDIFEVRGDTYPIKMVLKEVLGGRYRGSTKGWEFNKKDAEKVDQAVRDFYKNNTDGDLDNSISPSALPPQAIEPTDPGMQSMLEQSTRSKIMEKVKSLPGKLFKPKPATGEVLTSRQDITEHVIKKLEVTVAKGRAVGLGRNLGIYRSKPYSKLIALKIANDIDTLAHEVGHYVHDILFDMKTPKEFDSELHQLGLATSRPSYSEEQIIREGQAEFFRHLMISPNAAYQRAPMYYEAFIQRLKYDSELNDAISELQAMFQRYLAQSPMQRFTAHIAYDGKNTVPRSPNEETIPQMLYRNVYNDLIPLQRMTKDLTGKNFLKDATQDAFVLAEMAAGVPGMVEGWIRFGVTLPDGERLSKGIEQIFEEYDIKGKKKYLDFSNYLAAKRIVELYEQAFEGKRKLKMGDKDGSLGISYKDAKAVLAELESDTFSKAAKDVYEWSDGILEYLVYRGYASKEQVNAIRSANMNYVPLNRVMDETEEASSGSGKSLANRPRGFKMLFGSGRRILPPIEQLIINASRLASNAERNNAAVKAFELIGKSPNGGLWADKVTRPIAPVEGQLAEIEKSIRESFAGTIEDSDVIDEIIQQMNLSETFQLWRPIAHNRSNMEVAININGRTNIWRVNDRTLYNALTLKDSRTTNVFVRLLTIPKGIKRTGIVVSPSFWTGVTQADQYIAIITTKFGYLPLRIGKYGISSDYINGVIAQITENETYKAWLNSRASISGVIDQSRPNVKRTLNRSAETKLERIIKDVIIPTRWIQALESFASIFENATRIGEFSRGMQIQGKGELGFTKAGYASRNVSADFARSGQWARFVGTAKAFFNAGLQGDLAWFQAAKRNPVGFFAKGLLFMSLPQLALNYLLRDNEDYEERVAERELYWLIPTSSDFKNNTNWYRVRKPWNLGVFFGSIIPSVYQEAFLEGQKPMLDYLFPTPEDAMAVITSMIPDVIMPFMEVMSGDQGYNYFFQQSIDPYWDKDLEPYMRYDDRNSTAEIKLGRVLNRSPRKIRHLIRGYFGTAGMEFSDLLGATIDQIEASEKPPKPSLRPGQNIPGVRPFVSPYLSANRAISVQQFYEIKDAATRVYNTNKAITDPVEGDIYQRENKFLIDTYSDIVKEDNKLRKIKDDISATYVDPDMSPDDKRIKINRLNKEIIDTAKRFIERQKQLEKELE